MATVVVDASPLNLATTRASSSVQHGERPSPASSRVRRSVDTTLQKCLVRRAGNDALALERAHHAQLRREAAQLRRSHADLSGQLRVRDAQVEQLKTMLKEFVQQRSIGLYARQLHLQDGALCALHEEFQAGADVATPLPGAAAAAAVAAATAATAAAVGGSCPTVRTGRSAATGGYPVSAAASGERRGSIKTLVGGVAINGGTAAPRRDRDRSVSAAPHTPRGKLRDVVGHPTRVAVETPATRRRTTSVARAIGRSTSAEDRTARRPRGGDGLAAMARARR